MSHKGFAVVRVEGLQGLEDLLNSSEGKVNSWQRVGESATFIAVLEGVKPQSEVVAAAPVEEAEEANGNKAKKKSA